MKRMGLPGNLEDGPRMVSYPETVFNKIASAIAYGRLRRDGFGGRQRTIHTVECHELAGAATTVDRWFFVKTGTYVPGHFHRDLDGEGDYDPPYLEDEKTHRILMLSDRLGEIHALVGGELMIEAANVERLEGGV